MSPKMTPWPTSVGADGKFSALVTTRLAIMSNAMHPRISSAIGSLIEQRGKRFRPQLINAAAGWPTQWPDDHVTLGAAVELIHIGSLLHDDVIDRASERRGRSSAFATHGAELAVLAGTACFAAVGGMVATFEHEYVRAVAEAVDELADGELRDVERAFKIGLDEAEYIEIVAAKTGALFGLCCRLGSMLARESISDVDAYGNFGVAFGTAFQILDDCIDFSTHAIGKTVGTDCRLGLFGLPIVAALHDKTNQASVDQLATLLLADNWNCASQEAVATLVIELGGFNKALDVADRTLAEGRKRMLQHCTDAKAINFADFVEQAYLRFRRDVA